MKRLRTHTSHLTYVSLASLIIVVRRSIRGLKHDPDDEPAATTLDPDYFNFEGMLCTLRPFALFSSSHHCALQKKTILLIRPTSRNFSMMKSFLLSRLFKASQIYSIISIVMKRTMCIQCISLPCNPEAFYHDNKYGKATHLKERLESATL